MGLLAQGRASGTGQGSCRAGQHSRSSRRGQRMLQERGMMLAQRVQVSEVGLEGRWLQSRVRGEGSARKIKVHRGREEPGTGLFSC